MYSRPPSRSDAPRAPRPRVRISTLAAEWGVDFADLLTWLSGSFPCVRDDPTMTVSADLATYMRRAVRYATRDAA